METMSTCDGLHAKDPRSESGVVRVGVLSDQSQSPTLAAEHAGKRPVVEKRRMIILVSLR
jgi:hypothetical protein